MANWFYVAGSICFLIGTVINMTISRNVTSETSALLQSTPRENE